MMISVLIIFSLKWQRVKVDMEMPYQGDPHLLLDTSLLHGVIKQHQLALLV